MFGRIKIPENLTPEERTPEVRAMEYEMEVAKKKRISIAIQSILGSVVGTAIGMGVGFGVPAARSHLRAAEVLSSAKSEGPEKTRLKKLSKSFIVIAGEHRGLYAEAPGERPQLKNFEKLGISKELLDEILKTYPRSWSAHNVESIEYKEEAMFTPKSYGLKNSEAIAQCARPERGKRHRISFSISAKQASANEILGGTMAHELAHAHDFLYGRLPPERRLAFLSKVLERLESDTRFRSAYVEDINNKDKAQELGDKAMEYWGEIFGTYLADPAIAKLTMPKEDIAIIEEYLKLVDADFDAEKSAAKRQEILLNFSQSDIRRKIPVELGKFLEEHQAEDLGEYLTERIDPLAALPLSDYIHLRDEMEARVKSMPRSWKGLYNAWVEGRRLKDLTRGMFNSRGPQMALFGVEKIRSNNEGFDIMLSKMELAERERAKQFFEEMETMFNVELSHVAPHLTLPLKQSGK